ncbi:unnamed protein product [Brachionus calyciflorus]|uniref:dihydrofolate reductase n=1 Tax=Brachionus calyciflorus TaxID=104777 RepID=A0A813N8A3_9BILA|nr:unnamed protein product [Brachionus calyciflorus]
MRDKLISQPIKLNLIVAMNNSNRGIGVNGTIPWRIPKDLKHFAKITTFTRDSSKKNAVLMGRKTWFSLPKNFRPLPNRLNVIISSNLNLETCEPKENTDLNNILIFKSFNDAVETLIDKYSDKLENIYAIGGSMIYKEALQFPKGFLNRIYLTRVFSDIECDTFMEPENFLDNFKKLDLFEDEENVGAEFNKMQTENANNLNYIFEVYEKI